MGLEIIFSPPIHVGQAIVIHAPSTETASGNTDDVDVEKWISAESCIDVTAIVDMASCDIYLEGKDETSGKYKTIHTANFTAPTTNFLTAGIEFLAFRKVRARWVFNTPGVSPSITFSLALQVKS